MPAVLYILLDKATFFLVLQVLMVKVWQFATVSTIKEFFDE